MVAASVGHGVQGPAGRRASRPARAGSAGRRVRLGLAGLLVLAAGLPAAPSRAQGDWLAPVARFPLASADQVGGLAIEQRSSALQPITVAGACGAFVGQGDGSFEAWTWPVKLLSHLRLTARLENYTVPIDVNDQSAEITVQPDHTTITFAHAAFTVREILFATQCDKPGDTGVVAMFQIASTRPLDLTLSFTPDLERMWPAANYNAPTPEWVSAGTGHGGYYLLHTDSAALAGAVAIPGAAPGILAPYQERPKDYPLQLVLHYDPTRDGDQYYPLLMAAGTTAATATRAALTQQLASAATNLRQLYEQTASYYKHFFDTRVIAETPDARFDQALRWAEVSIDQLRVRHASAAYGSELGLVAGLYSSGDSDRPGFGWFFGRDSLYTLYAVDSYGDFSLTRAELDFLLKRERDDGKIMHEYSQTAELVDWAHLPYEYAAADSTPLLLMLLRDYAERSGDLTYVQHHWLQIAKAWQFERTHDSDGDGIYDNAQGTGWVESWPPGMPHQEVYLAALDVEASQAYARLAALAGKPDEGAAERAVRVAATLEREYRPAAGNGVYAFSYEGDSGGRPRLDTTATIYPSVAWWDGSFALGAGGQEEGGATTEEMFRRWASHEFSTDWGTRDLGEHEALYDPMSYHQGSVWPLFTGWASLAEYRTARPLSGYAHLMQNANLTWAQDLGAVTELLSGQYFEPFGRSTTHQLWSSAMVLSPALRGLFGVSFDAGSNTLKVAPQLPATWDHATLRHVPAGEGKQLTVIFERSGAAMTVRLQPEKATASMPRLAGPAGSEARAGLLRVPLAGAEIAIPAQLPLPGAVTAQLKVLSQHADATSATWVLEAQGGSTCTLPLRLNGIHMVTARGAVLHATASLPRPAPLAGDALLARPPTQTEEVGGLQSLEVRFPAGAGYTEQTVTVRW